MGRRVEFDEDRFVEMYRAGYTFREIGLELDLTVSFMRDKVKELGLPSRFNPVQIDEQEFKEAYFAGLNCRELAKKFKINRSRVATITRKLGLREKEIAAHRMPIEA